MSQGQEERIKKVMDNLQGIQKGLKQMGEQLAAQNAKQEGYEYVDPQDVPSAAEVEKQQNTNMAAPNPVAAAANSVADALGLLGKALGVTGPEKKSHAQRLQERDASRDNAKKIQS